MGCTGSKSTSKSGLKEVVKKQSEGLVGETEPSASQRKSVRPLTETEIRERIETTEEAKQFVRDGLTIRYAWLSQRGYYPHDPSKDNQDAFICLPEFDAKSSLFGVFDGHGKDGHHCARYARDVLPSELTEKLQPLSALSPSISEAKLAQELRHATEVAFLSTNFQMKSQRRFDSEFSGTTAVTVLLRERKMYVANVGDSRCIIISENSDGNFFARPLSSDQTPYREDERNRVKKYGARVMSMDQMEGLVPMHEDWGNLNLGDEIDEGGDPPRVWHAKEAYPGTAFTRSLGDALAETLGVVAEPEIMERELCENDCFVVIASDGVFEFLTNQMVADLITASQGDVLAACKAIVGEAYNMWLQYEVRTDDITIIILAVEGGAGSTRMSRASSVSNNTDAALPEIESKPVRRVISKEKKKNMIQTKSEEDVEGIDEEGMAALTVPKCPADEEAISSAIKSNFLFQHLNSQQRAQVIGVMQPVEVRMGEWVITQDDHGDRFYVVQSGRYEVRVRPSGQPDPTGGFVVHVYESSNGQHPGFGELSLMYGKPRAASVIALEDGKLWALDRRVFKGVVMRSMDMRKDAIRALRTVELFKCLNLQRLQRLADLLVEQTFSEGDVLSTIGEPCDTLFIIMAGEVEVSDAEGRRVLTVNQVFGAESMLAEAAAQSSSVCLSGVRARVVRRDAFDDALGELEDLQEEHRMRNERSQMTTAGPARFDDITLEAVVGADSVSVLILGSFAKIASPQSRSVVSMEMESGGSSSSGSSSSSSSSSSRNGGSSCNATVRSFNLGDVDALKLHASVVTMVETARVICHAAAHSAFVPRVLSVYRDTNALHLLFNTPVVSDLYSFVHPPPPDGAAAGSTPPPPPPPTMLESDIQYVGACIASALEALHSLGIVYRAIQPEGVHVDAQGRIVLLDFRVCKVGGVGARSFTICGAADYLAPEQISQRGHGAPVDLWALGVLLYELAYGATPFSANSEVATYSKISSFGSPSFASLVYPDPDPPSGSPMISASGKSAQLHGGSDKQPPLKKSASFAGPLANLKSLVNRLLVPAPEARLGASSGGFRAIQSHPFFRETQWTTFASTPSPLSDRARRECSDLLAFGMKESADVVESFGRAFEPAGADWTSALMH